MAACESPGGGSLNQAVQRAMRHFRAKRMRQFADMFAITPRTRVLDAGGSMSNWLLLGDVCPRVTILNLTRAGERPLPGFEWVLPTDARSPSPMAPSISSLAIP